VFYTLRCPKIMVLLLQTALEGCCRKNKCVLFM